MYYWSWSKTAGQHTITTSVINILRNWNHVGSLTWSYLPFFMSYPGLILHLAASRILRRVS